ncbi:hypothetical protein LCGC14_1017270 [marine sediment metagenome]|uniref:Uncharacterized protein n=1 Tax=marine sediment metagenome TaxID=412755 RepID=A0A0F9R4J5_9ZZZZ
MTKKKKLSKKYEFSNVVKLKSFRTKDGLIKVYKRNPMKGGYRKLEPVYIFVYKVENGKIIKYIEAQTLSKAKEKFKKGQFDERSFKRN